MPLTSLSVYKMQFMAALLIAQGLFLLRLPVRSRFPLRAAAAAAGCFLAALAFPILSYDALYISVMFLAFFALTIPAARFCFGAGWRGCVFCTVAGYSVQHLASVCYDMALTIAGFSGSTQVYSNAPARFDPIPAAIFLEVYALVYWALYQLFARRMKKGEDMDIQRPSLLVLVALVYTADVIIGYHAIMKMSVICAWLFFALLGYFFVGGGQAQYILETGITAIGNLAQNFIGMVTWADPLRASGDGSTGFVQSWTVFYWAYWMAWCVATPFFVGVISKGRTIRGTIIGGYIAGLSSTFLSFIVFGNYGLGLEMRGRLDVSGAVAAGADIPTVIISVFRTLPLPFVALALLFITMVLFYATTFDSLTMVVAAYSYRRLADVEDPHHAVRIFWAFIFIIFPIGLINAQSSLSSLQSVSIVAAFPIGIVIVLLVASFLRDAGRYLEERKHSRPVSGEED